MSDDLDRIKARSDQKGVVPKPPIPRLDADPIVGPDGESLSMSEQAEQGLQNKGDPRHPEYDPNREPAQPHRTRGPFEALPEDAPGRPGFRPGVGSGFVANQPDLQAPAQEAQPGKLSPQTVQGLDELGRFQKEAEGKQEKEIEEAARPEDATTRMMEEMGFADPEFLEAMQQERARSRIDRPDVRKAIEARCSALDLDQLISDGEAHQQVPIVRGKVIATFRTYSGAEELELHRMMGAKQLPNKNFAQAKFALIRLVVGLHELNGTPMPEHRGSKRRIDQEKFQHKLEVISAFSLQLLNSLSVNYAWFLDRAEALFVDVGELKNG